MKHLLYILCLTAITVNAQTPNEFFLSAGADFKMLFVGPYPERDNPQKGLDFKAAFGWEFPATRIRMEVQSFAEIGFTKWTYLAFDYKRESIFKNIWLYIGLEASGIKRHHPDFTFKDPNNYLEYVHNWMLLGANAELQWRKGNIGLAAQFNIHQAENDLKPYKNFRSQVHCSVFWFFD